LPVAFWTFLIGAASLSALPLVTAGFYSKDKILWDVFSSPRGGTLLWAAGLAGALLTALYTFRVVFRVFFGEPSHKVLELSPLKQPGLLVAIPLVVLAVFSILAGFLELPETLGNSPVFSNFMLNTLPPLLARANPGAEALLQIASAVAVLFGLVIAYLFFLRHPDWSSRLALSYPGIVLVSFWFSGWGFDWLYERLIIHPYVRLATVSRDDIFDWMAIQLVARPYAALARFSKADLFDAFFGWIAELNAVVARALSRLQSGYVRWYAAGIVMGAIILIGVAVLR
jgi:NADH-quinone oxidoreductase subunit L